VKFRRHGLVAGVYSVAFVQVAGAEDAHASPPVSEVLVLGRSVAVSRGASDELYRTQDFGRNRDARRASTHAQYQARLSADAIFRLSGAAHAITAPDCCAKTTCAQAFDVGSVPYDAAASPEEARRDYRDYVHYVQSTQGHLNGGEGLCFVQRRYPSPN